MGGLTRIVETCPCGAVHEGDGITAISFRKAHAQCRERPAAVLDSLDVEEET